MYDKHLGLLVHWVLLPDTSPPYCPLPAAASFYILPNHLPFLPFSFCQTPDPIVVAPASPSLSPQVFPQVPLCWSAYLCGELVSSRFNTCTVW